MRFIAILLVVFTHVHEQIGVSSYITRAVFYHIDRLGVPLFFMLSGALILPRAAKQPVFTFYKKRIFQFIVLLFVYSFLSKLTEMLSTGFAFSESIIVSFKLFNAIYPNQIGAGHLWFMYTIIGLYLIAPFLGRLLDVLTTKEIMVFLVLSILLTQFKATLQGGFNVHPNILYSIGNDFLGGYLNFFVLGYLLIHRKIKTSIVVSLVLLVLPIVIALAREIHKEQFLDAFHWYSTSLTIVTSSIGLLGAIRWLCENGNRNLIIESVSKFSFGIYLSHYIFIFVFKKWIDFSHFDLSMKLAVLFVPSFVCAYLFTWLLSRTTITRFFVM